MARLLRFHKPAGVLSQFTDSDRGRATLAVYIQVPEVYVAGRLDRDSEGLLLLTDDGQLQARLSHPRHKVRKTYRVQIEGMLDRENRQRLLEGIELRDGNSRFVRVTTAALPEGLGPRRPPLPDHREANATWLEVVLTTGRNRQVRRTLAAVGHPVLRLIRTRVGPFALEGLAPGEWQEQAVHLPRR